MSKPMQYALRLWLDVRGQDLVEYALLGGFVSVAAGAVFPMTALPAISMIFSKVLSVLEKTVKGMG